MVDEITLKRFVQHREFLALKAKKTQAARNTLPDINWKTKTRSNPLQLNKLRSTWSRTVFMYLEAAALIARAVDFSHTGIRSNERNSSNGNDSAKWTHLRLKKKRSCVRENEFGTNTGIWGKRRSAFKRHQRTRSKTRFLSNAFECHSLRLLFIPVISSFQSTFTTKLACSRYTVPRYVPSFIFWKRQRIALAHQMPFVRIARTQQIYLL